jgi:cell filamentation protein
VIDPYLYPNTEVLKNKFDVRDNESLNTIEAEYTSSRLKDVYENWHQDFTYDALCHMHYTIFQDVYAWAGQPRTVNIEKAESVLNGISIEYSDMADIKHLAESAIAKAKAYRWEVGKLDEKAERFSAFMAELWKIHPFREGNTRTVVTYCCKFAVDKGIAIDTKLFEQHAQYLRNSLVAASACFTDPALGDKSKQEYLIRIVKDAMQRGV